MRLLDGNRPAATGLSDVPAGPDCQTRAEGRTGQINVGARLIGDLAASMLKQVSLERRQV
ncbi:MAG: hypothetical protein M3495_19945 [Pseudomonadota bacterium]|nr:hypothetical protein [Pseudomonadota bacterium]